MKALVAAFACSVMMLPALGALEVAALRAEVAELRQREPGPPRDESSGRG